MEYIQLPGVGRIKVRRGVHIKYMSVRMAPGREIWVNVPYGVSGTMVKDFLLEKREWLERNKEHIRKYEKDTGLKIEVGKEIKTKLYTLNLEHTNEKRLFYRIEDRDVRLFIPQSVPQKEIEGVVRNFLLVIYRKESEELLPDRVRELAKQHRFVYNKLSFRNNISNWGSCSFENNISLNIKLMKLPDEIIDYVILHELCHIVEKNHSADFWNLMERVCPDYKARRAILRECNVRV